jgi:hypothetical protein
MNAAVKPASLRHFAGEVNRAKVPKNVLEYEGLNG